MKDLDVQMKDLDNFVAKAKSQNANHHEQHVDSVSDLSDTVQQSFSNISAHFKDTFSRVEDLGEEMDAEAERLRDSLQPLDEQLCEPLSNLREDIRNTMLREYEPTGETPAKVQYQYPTELPRTSAHEALLADMRDAPTPSKAAASMVFSDTTLSPGARSPSRLSIVSTLTETARNPLGMSLREVNPNVSTGSLMFDPSASILSLSAVDETESTGPPAKRGTRGSRLAKKKTISSVAEGLENLPPSVTTFAQGASRRKSPRLN